ncbi:MAG TPA: GTP 3',8-cyclase MoaA [Vicinamibacterales bacterium]|nr:GTP 3',8-cyclase MoaA [Vicinamibacterales bacterium]
MPLQDRFGRPLRSLRISVTDRCNLRCQYCMPEPEYVWLPRENLLTFEEIVALTDAFTGEGVDRVRITGGEPLLRREITQLVAMLAERPAIRDLAMTTNGILLKGVARALRDAGLHRVTVSLDTLRRERFRALTGSSDHDAVLAGIQAAADAGFSALKIDTVVIRGTNDDELIDLIEYGRSMQAEVRFIEYMDVGGATRWSPAAVVPRAEMLETIARHYGGVLAMDHRASAPAERFVLPDGTTFGIIASTTAPFCADCDRARLTADGIWLLCLYAAAGTDLRRPLRAGATNDELRQLIRAVWTLRADRGAEERLGMDRQTTLVPLRALKKDAHLEMHTRGG